VRPAVSLFGRVRPLVAALGALVLAGCSGKIVDSEGPPPGAGLAPSGGTSGSSGLGSGGSAANGGTTTNDGTGGSTTGGTPGGGGSASGSSGMASGGTGQVECISTASPGAPVPIRRLSASQVERTAAELFAVDVKLDVSDEHLLAYRSNISSSVDASSARGYYDFAASVVARADLSRCATDCQDWLLDEIGLKLFRRPLAAEERERYAALYELALEDGSPAEAASWVLEAMLQSPSFLYFDEVVKADGTLDDYAVAGRLSLLLWARNPDAALLQRAADGELSTTAQLEAEVTRLLADARSGAGIAEFVDQWLDLSRLDDPDVRPDLAELGADVVNALRSEPVLFFRSLLDGGAGMRDLLTSTQTVVSEELEELYGADIVDTNGDAVELDAERRGGILSLPGVAAALSHARRTSPTLRGRAVLGGLLCTPPEPPPANVDTTLPEVAEGVSTRERLEQHMTSAACRGCHAPMDGIGFSLEKLDWLGRFREEENGVAVNDESTFPLGAATVTVTGAAELGAVLAESPDVAACFSKQWLRYSLGITETSDTDCLVAELAADVQASNGLERLIVKSLTSDWFRRGPGEAP
jgi:hypothetical protein